MIIIKKIKQILTFRFNLTIFFVYLLSKSTNLLKLPGKDYLNALLELISFCYYPLRKPTFYITRYAEYPLAISSLSINIKEKVVDLGCGDSPLSLFLKYKDRNIISIDNFLPSLLRLKKHSLYETDDPKNIDIVVSDCSCLGIKSESIDKVICISVLEHLHDDLDIKAMYEIARILKKGGLAFISFEMSDPESVEWHIQNEYIGEDYNFEGEYKQFCRRYSFSSIKERLLSSNLFTIKDGGYFNSPLFIRDIFDNNGIKFFKKYFDWSKPILGLFFLIFRRSFKSVRILLSYYSNSFKKKNIMDNFGLFFMAFQKRKIKKNLLKKGSFSYLLLEKK